MLYCQNPQALGSPRCQDSASCFHKIYPQLAVLKKRYCEYVWCLQGGGENLRGFFKVPSLFGIRSGLHFLILCIPTSTLHEEDSVPVDNNLTSLMITWWSAWITLNHILLPAVVYSMFPCFLQIPTHPVTDSYFCSSGFYLENVPKSVKVIAKQLDQKNTEMQMSKASREESSCPSEMAHMWAPPWPWRMGHTQPSARAGSWQQRHVEIFYVRLLGSCTKIHMEGRACPLSHFSRVRLFGTLWTVAPQAPLSMGFTRQEHWGGLPCPPPGDLPSPGIESSVSSAPALQADSLLLSHQGSPYGTAVMPQITEARMDQPNRSRCQVYPH